MSNRDLTGGDPTLHTAIIGDIPMMWQKLAWDVDQFDDIQRANPDIPEPLAFAAINVCISADSLANWVVSDVVRRQRVQGKPAKEQDARIWIYSHVRQQQMCEAIANTAKHSQLRSGGWPFGSVRIEFEDGDEDRPPGYTLRHVHGDATEGIALNAFMHLETNWWGALQMLGYAFPQHRLAYDWRQRRIDAMFGFSRGDRPEG